MEESDSFCYWLLKQIQEFGVTEVRDLKPGGRNLPVTEENKKEYMKYVCQMKMTGAIRKQLNAFLEGFYDIIPKRLISIFNEQELELLISGLPTIDIDDLKSNTEYHKYQPTSLQVKVWTVQCANLYILPHVFICFSCVLIQSLFRYIFMPFQQVLCNVFLYLTLEFFYRWLYSNLSSFNIITAFKR